jgi:hypothetical protein
VITETSGVGIGGGLAGLPPPAPGNKSQPNIIAAAILAIKMRPKIKFIVISQ